MRFVRRLATVAAVVFGALHPAYAADAPLFTWTGFYVGGSLGYGWQSDATEITGNTPLIAALIPTGSIPKTQSLNSHGWLFGAQAGYNWQINRAVLGVEADFSLADIEGQAGETHPGPVLPFATYTTSTEQRMQWLSTVRGRLGYTPVDRLLVYATGGLAIGRIDYGANITRSAILLKFSLPASATVTKTGWTAGGGAEYALNSRLSLKAEYLYYDLGSESITGLEVPVPIILTRNSATYRFTNAGNIVRLGLNYKFN